ncbi:hypothetical protein F4703DRAFT_1868082 [Phycomyces blakesleeanus]
MLMLILIIIYMGKYIFCFNSTGIKCGITIIAMIAIIIKSWFGFLSSLLLLSLLLFFLCQGTSCRARHKTLYLVYFERYIHLTSC